MAVMYANTYIRLFAFRVLANMRTWVSDFTLSLIHSFSLIIRYFIFNYNSEIRQFNIAVETGCKSVWVCSTASLGT